MCTFPGVLVEQELSFLRIDNFENDIQNGKIFLLSHFHSDHFKGLFEKDFVDVVNKNTEVFIYCTKVTKNLIMTRQYSPIPPDKIVEMNINYPYFFDGNYTSNYVTVTALPAGHCPGSVMFLIEFGDMRILYTGDLRIKVKDIKNYSALHDNSGLLKPIHTLYLDTTFCDPKWLVFPTRAESISDIETLATSWLLEDHKRQVGIRYNTYCGLEWVLSCIAKKCNTTIWIVDKKAYDNFKMYPEVCQFLKSSKGNSKIHLCGLSFGQECSVCSMHKDVMLVIKPCALSFDYDLLEKQSFSYVSKNFVRVAYSTHSSFLELSSFVRYLQPKVIIPIVIPLNQSYDQAIANLSMDVEAHLSSVLSKNRVDHVQIHDGVHPQTSTLSTGTNLMEWSSNRDSENPITKILRKTACDSSLALSFSWSSTNVRDLVSYNIVWNPVGFRSDVDTAQNMKKDNQGLRESNGNQLESRKRLHSPDENAEDTKMTRDKCIVEELVKENSSSSVGFLDSPPF